MAETLGPGMELSPEVLRTPEALRSIFLRDRLVHLIRRMRNHCERDRDAVVHPLKALILTEYGEQLADQLSRIVPIGAWHPSPAYLCFTHKRSGGYRELV